MKEYTTGIKSAVIVIHQMFIVLMVCGLFGTGYVAQRDLQGMGLLMHTTSLPTFYLNVMV